MDNLNKYLEGVGASTEVRQWVQSVGAKAVRSGKTDQSELEHIVDYLNSPRAPARLRKMSFVQAKESTMKWVAANKKKGRGLVDSAADIDMVHSYPSGHSIVKLKTKSAYQREGTLMSHCLGGYTPQEGVTMYSYRDKKNNPHATFEVRESGGVLQIKGKGNGVLDSKYIEPVMQFLELLGMNIRESEMRNLGYYHIDESHLEYISDCGMGDQVCMVRGKHYAR